MNPLKTPPPIPARAASISRTANEVSGFCTAIPHPSSGSSSSALLSQTSLRVPRIGGRNIHTSRSDPPARPGMAASQYNWLFDKSKPIELSTGARAETRNHVAKARVRLKVVIHSVFHARPESQVAASSGFQLSSQSPPLRSGVLETVALMRLLLSCLHPGSPGSDRVRTCWSGPGWRGAAC